MAIVRFVVWTAVCVGLGLLLGTYELGGQTAWERTQGLWKQKGPRLEKVRDDAENVVDGVKKKVGTVTAEVSAPKEKHTKEDRQAIDSIIAKHGQR